MRLGEWNLNQSNDCQSDLCSDDVIDVPIRGIIAHDMYDPDSLHQRHDIALIRLAKPVEYTRWIRPICLPLNRNLRSKSYDGVPMEVAGWGLTSTDADGLLVEIDLLIIILIYICIIFQQSVAT